MSESVGVSSDDGWGVGVLWEDEIDLESFALGDGDAVLGECVEVEGDVFEFE